MYSIHYTTTARKNLIKLPRLISKRIFKRIEELKENPFHNSNVKKLVVNPYYRLRIGDYRVVFDVLNEELIILIVKIAHRKKSYK